MRCFTACALAIALAGCAPAPPAIADPHRVGLQEGEDTCGSRSFAHLLGRPASEAAPQLGNRTYRLIGDGDPVTLDFSPQRLNVHYDKRSGLIIGIKCG